MDSLEPTLPGAPENSLLPYEPAVYRDRSGGLVAFGIVQIVLGGLTSLAIPFLLLGALLSGRAGAGMPLRSYAVTVLSYAFAAALLITMGVGSIRARRWARTLSLIVSWAWLLFGIIMTVFVTVMLPTSFLAAFQKAAASNPNASGMPTGFLAVILTIVIVFFAIFLVVVPLVLLLFYRRKDVQETVKRRDPAPHWTDRCPPPVLAACLLFTWACPYYLVMSFTMPLIPFFGRYLTGVPGALGCLVLAALDAYLAYSLFHLRLAGWWVAMAALAIRTASAAVTFAHGDLLQAYSRMGFQDAQIQAINENPMFRSHLILWLGVGFLLAFIGYMLWIKRYFRPLAEPAVPAAAPLTS